MILAEKAAGRRDLIEKLEKWLRELVDEASGRMISLEEGFDGWITLTPDDELIRSIISIQTRLNPMAAERPPFPARVLKLTDSKILLEYPTIDGTTARVSFLTSFFAGSLGYSGDQPRMFLESLGIFEGAPISLAAGSLSINQLKLLSEQTLRGLDRIMIFNAVAGEVDKVLSGRRLRNLIAYHEALTLLTHVLYVRLGAGLEKAVERVEEEMKSISKAIFVKPLSWKILLKIAGKEPFFNLLSRSSLQDPL